MIEAKGNFTSLPIRHDVKIRMMLIRDKYFPRENVSEFVGHMVEVFELYCVKEIPGICPECRAPWDSEHNRCTANPEHCT
jgi:hypothetical protein